MGNRNAVAVRNRLNNWTAVIIAMVVLLTPLVLGGNRPAIWAISATILAGWTGCYFAVMSLSRARPHAIINNFPLVSSLFGAMAAYNAVQLLPIYDFLPSGLIGSAEAINFGTRITLTPGDTGLALIRWLSYGIFAYLTTQAAVNPTRSKLLLWGLFWAVVVHALYGLILLFQFNDTILFADKWAYAGVATGAFVNRNSYATFLAMGAVVGVTLLGDAFRTRYSTWRRAFDTTKHTFHSTLTFCGLLVIIAALTLTGSRMGFFVACCGVVTILLLMIRRPRLILIIAVTAVLFTAIIAALSLYGSSLLERVVGVERDASTRLELYRQVIGMIFDRPIIGFGGQSFEYAYPLYHQAPVSFDSVWDKAHSTYLTLWVEYGLVFGSFPIMIVAICFFRLLKLDSLQTREASSIAAIACVLVVALHSLVDFSLEIQGVTFLFTAILANGLGRVSSRSATLPEDE